MSKYTCARVYVHYATREEYSPILGKYPIPRARVCTCARGKPRGCPGTIEGRRGCGEGFLRKKCKEEREI